MNKPCYELNTETRHIVRELIKKCKELDLGNLNFQYYARKGVPFEVFFYINQYNDYWELIVKKSKVGLNCYYTDIYKIYNDNNLSFYYSDED
jgi:hypothetical protein